MLSLVEHEKSFKTFGPSVAVQYRLNSSANLFLLHELCHEKVSVQSFRPVPAETGLYSHRPWLEAV